ncbi:MAG TPA: TOMM precursor leader peptide-binding protein [Cellvibrionaceae bacterium]|nr:TOMM precursor leader peptide-binding protein [Cellvibrionaceae bacterium]HMW70544.1 TOMM precursor leader peptide-binding protein [Cellvibrionaceae bacterium]
MSAHCTPYWNPSFICEPHNEAWVLISEGNHYSINGQEAQILDDLIQNNGQLYHYLFAQPDTLTQVKRLRFWDYVRQLNLVLECSPTQPQATNSAGAILPLLNTQGFLPYVVLDPISDPDWLTYAPQAPWVLIKPFGAQPSIGPIFTGEGPCPQCLHTRLLNNQPARRWQQFKRGLTLPPAVPMQDQTPHLAKIADFFNQYLAAAARNPAHAHCMWVLNKDLNAYTEHRVATLPQCPRCGDPHLTQHTFTAPINLTPVFANADLDGGYRTQNREDLLQELKHCISPVTGVLTELTHISAEKAEQLMIYQAAYSTQVVEENFVQLSLGKGVANTQAQLSALGEAFERKAAQYQGDEPLRYALPQELPGKAYLPQELAAFSSAQYQFFAQWEQANLQQPQWVKPYAADTPIYWCPAWNLTRHRPVYFPAAFCLADTPFDDAHYSIYTHNGNSAGASIEEAILQGALELIERDAAAIWWYNRIPRPQIALEVIAPAQQKIIANTLGNEWDYWLLDISHDLPAVSCVAVGQHKIDGRYVLGFGCHLEVSIAAQRALTELYQLICIKDKVSGPFDFKAIKPHPFLYPRANTAIKYSGDYCARQNVSLHSHIIDLIEALQANQLDLCVVNYSRADVPLKTLKVVAPGLCHFWPQLATPRLYQVAVKLGWLSHPLTEAELNPQALYL